MSQDVSTQLTCTQCGGELHPDEGQTFLACPYCGATVYLDKSHVVFHWYVAPTLGEQEATAALYRWMSGSQTVKDLDKKARLVGSAFQYFPLWYFNRKSGDGKEEIMLRPAAATSVTELASLRLPPGDLRKYDPALDAQAAPPTVPLEAAMEWLYQGQNVVPGGKAQVLEMAVVHVPVYFFKYEYRGQTYTAVVDAASGATLASLYPAKAEAPYLAVGVVTALVYLCLALVPIVASASSSSNGGAIGFGICAGAGLVAAPFLFAWAFFVASKV
jgi:predicted RNA-binding Zn-ribbon protein involved in translation (DUF1610 family)